jgi:hypothetical protein
VEKNNTTDNHHHWETSNLQLFWSDIAAADHLVQVYEQERILLDSLEGFAGTALLAGNSVILVLRGELADAIEIRLRKHDFDLDAFFLSGQLTIANAEDLNERIVVGDWPHDRKFKQEIKTLIDRALITGKPLRVFTEMSALLLERDLAGAALHMETLWNKLRVTSVKFCLYCAYKAGILNSNEQEAAQMICGTHSKVIGGWKDIPTQISYRQSFPTEIKKDI